MFRQKSGLTWIGIIGAPAFLIFMLVAMPQLKGTVDKDHFELKSIGRRFNYRFEDLKSITIDRRASGIYRRGTEIINFYVVLTKKDGSQAEFTLADILKPLWPDIVANAKAHGVTYHDEHNYLNNPV